MVNHFWSSLVGMAAGRWSTLSVFLLAFSMLSCQGQPAPEEQPEVTCTPACSERACGDDGCGGVCGDCDGGQSCNSNGQCVDDTEPEGCALTCAEAGYECGEHCGELCGDCAGAQEECVDHTCLCVPACDAATCLKPDGCGEACGPCGNAVNCTTCALQLSVVDQQVTDGLLTEVTLALDYLPAEGQPLPSMADIRLSVSGPVRLKQVGLSEAVMAAGKELYVSPDTGKPFQVMADGVHQLLLFSTGNTNVITPGRWLLLRFAFGPVSAAEAAHWATSPAVIALVSREEILAPPGADSTLWGGGYDGPVVVWAQASEVDDEQ